MVLQNTLYNIVSSEKAETSGTYHIHLNPECFIYKAHFPEQPITPGVCVTQIAVELAQDLLGCPLTMTGAKNIKFLSLMTPDKQTEVSYTITLKGNDDTEVHFQAVAQSGEEVYAKLSLICGKAIA